MASYRFGGVSDIGLPAGFSRWNGIPVQGLQHRCRRTPSGWSSRRVVGVREMEDTGQSGAVGRVRMGGVLEVRSRGAGGEPRRWAGKGYDGPQRLMDPFMRGGMPGEGQGDGMSRFPFDPGLRREDATGKGRGVFVSYDPRGRDRQEPEGPSRSPSFPECHH